MGSSLWKVKFEIMKIRNLTIALIMVSLLFEAQEGQTNEINESKTPKIFEPMSPQEVAAHFSTKDRNFDIEIIFNSVAAKRNSLPPANTGNKVALGEYEYIVFNDDQTTDYFLQTNHNKIRNLKIAKFGPRFVVIDGTIILGYKDERDLNDLSIDYGLMIKHNYPKSKIAVLEPLDFEVIESLLETLRVDKRLNYARLDFRDPNLSPE